MRTFLDERLSKLLGEQHSAPQESHDVVLYGFGRIGRYLARLLIDRTGTGAKLRLRGVVIRAKGDVQQDLEKRAELLRRDSVHGEFDGSSLMVTTFSLSMRIVQPKLIIQNTVSKTPWW